MIARLKINRTIKVMPMPQIPDVTVFTGASEDTKTCILENP